MRAKLGHKLIAAMQPNQILWDDVVRGFLLRRQLSNVITFSVVYRTQEGVQRWMKIGRYGVFTPEQARSEAARVLREVALGNDPSAERKAIRNSLTVAQLCDDYVSDMQSGKVNGKKSSTIKTDISRIETHIKPKLGHRKVTGVTHEDVEGFIREMSPGSARRVVGLLGAIFSYSIKRKLRDTNPCAGVDKPADVRRVRRLSEAEYVQLQTATNAIKKPIIADIFTMLAITGFRSGEIKNLRWEEVDIERGIAILGETKTGVSIRPLSGAAIEIIKRQARVSPFVFTYQHNLPVSNLTPHWNALGLDRSLVPHIMRHSFASLGADLGLSDTLIAGLLGHKIGNITSRYQHLGDRALLKAADLVSNETIKLMQGRS